MARPTNTHLVQLVEDVPLADDLQVNLNTMSEHRLQIMAQFGDGLPYQRDRIVHEARFYMAQSAEAMLEAGKRLVILKENEPHGEFTEIVTEQLGLADRTARLLMQASLKYLSPTLEPKRQALAVLGKTKLFELMTEDEDELAELADGGTVAGMTLDDIDRMTSRELRQALRNSREELDSNRQLVASKDQKINELTTEKFKPLSPDDRITAIRNEVADISDKVVRELFGSLTDAFVKLDDDTNDRGISHAGFMAGLVHDIQREINTLTARFDLPDVGAVDDVPDWVKESQTQE